jgi:hypothetical protein
MLELHSQGKHAEARTRFASDIYDLAEKLKTDMAHVVPLPSVSGERPRIISENEWTYDGQTVIRSIDGNLLTVETDPVTGTRVKHDMLDLEALVERLEAGRSEVEDSAAVMAEGVAPLISKLKERLDVAVFFPTWNCFLTHPDWLQTFLRAFHTRPELVHRFERSQCRRAIANGRAAIDAGADVIGIGGDLAYRKGPMISPEKYHDFVMPYMRKESRALHRRGAYTMIASDGNLMPIALDYFLSSEIDAAREIEPGPMDRATVKEQFGDRVCLNGNVDCGRTLGLSTTREVVEETKDCIRLWSPGGGHILSSSNTISPNVKPKNFFAFWRAIFKYGRYH